MRMKIIIYDKNQCLDLMKMSGVRLGMFGKYEIVGLEFHCEF